MRTCVSVPIFKGKIQNATNISMSVCAVQFFINIFEWHEFDQTVEQYSDYAVEQRRAGTVDNSINSAWNYSQFELAIMDIVMYK